MPVTPVNNTVSSSPGGEIIPVKIGTITVMTVRGKTYDKVSLQKRADEIKNHILTVLGKDPENLNVEDIKIGTFNGYQVIYYGAKPTKDNLLITCMNKYEEGAANEWLRRLKNSKSQLIELTKKSKVSQGPVKPPDAPKPAEMSNITATSNLKGEVLINGNPVITFSGEKVSERAETVAKRINEHMKGTVDINKLSLEFDKTYKLWVIKYGNLLVTILPQDEANAQKGSFDLGLEWFNSIATALKVPESEIKARITEIENMYKNDMKDKILEKAEGFLGKLYEHGFNCQEYLAKVLEAAGFNYFGPGGILETMLNTPGLTNSGLGIIKITCNKMVETKVNSGNIGQTVNKIYDLIADGGVGIFQIEGGGNGHTGLIFMIGDKLVAYHSGGFDILGDRAHKVSLQDMIKGWVEHRGSSKLYVGSLGGKCQFVAAR